MAKRKTDCSIDAFVVKYLKKAKFDKILDLFEENIVKQELTSPKMSEQFLFYLKQPRIKQEREDDLGFEINFGAYESTQVNLSLTYAACKEFGGDIYSITTIKDMGWNQVLYILGGKYRTQTDQKKPQD